MTVEKIRGGNENRDNFPVGLRVLAVDDDPTCLMLLDTLLKKCQYDVTSTSQARVALKMLRENKDRFDLVISDVHMPDMDGFKLLELVGLEMDLPVIMLSANSDPKLVMKGVTHGACDYLVKPIRIEELRNIWQHVIRRKKFDSKNQNKSADQVQGNRTSGEGHGNQMMTNADQNGKFNRKRKDEDDENEDYGNESEDPATQKKPRVVWSIELHRKFVAAVNQLGIEKAVPKRILDLMKVEGLSRENVASHLQKYRLYLKRISSVATQQANMAAALGVKDSPFMRISPFEGLGDFRTLAGPGRLANAALSPYTTGGMLGRLNTPANVNLRNLTPSTLIQPQNLSNSINPLGKMHSVLPSANQNPSFFQGIPSSLELDQLQQNKCATGIVNFNAVDDSRMHTARSISSSDSTLNGTPNNNPMMLHGNYQQSPSGGGFTNQLAHNMASFNSDSFNVLNGGPIQSSQMQQPNSLLPTEPFQNRLPMNTAQENNFSSGSYLQNNPIDISSTTVALPLDDSRDIQSQEPKVGDIQNITQTPNQRWGEQGQSYGQNSEMTFGSLNAHIPLSQSLDRDSGTLNEKMGIFVDGRLGGGASSLMQQNENEPTELRARSNENFLMEQPKVTGGFIPRTYDSLDDMMNAMIKREQDETIPNCDFRFDDYSFGSVGSCIENNTAVPVVDDFRTVQRDTMAGQDTVAWRPPTGNTIKVNFDGALPRHTGTFRVAMVARNANGECLWWAVKTEIGSLQPAEVKAKAALFAVRMSLGRGWSSVYFEGDNLMVINALNSSEKDSSSIGAITEETKQAASAFTSCRFMFTRREGNALARALATSDYSVNEFGCNLPVYALNIV